MASLSLSLSHTHTHTHTQTPNLLGGIPLSWYLYGAKTYCAKPINIEIFKFKLVLSVFRQQSKQQWHRKRIDWWSKYDLNQANTSQTAHLLASIILLYIMKKEGKISCGRKGETIFSYYMLYVVNYHKDVTKLVIINYIPIQSNYIW